MSKKVKRKQKPLDKQLPRKEERLYTFFAYLTFSKTVCTIKHIRKSMLIRDFKETIVLTCGVPFSIQRLHYLDSCELDEEEELNSLDIVDNASFRLNVWNNFEKLMRCIHENDLEALLTCNIQAPKEIEGDGNNKSDESNSVLSRETHEQSEYTTRGKTALFVASQLGRLDIVKKLIEMGVDVNSKTGLGYTPLHGSVAGGHYECIDYLLEQGAHCDTKSTQAKKAMSIASINGYSESERHLHSFEWQTRAKNVQPSHDVPLMMHQQFDSQNPAWFKGEHSTKYICATLPRTEFSGSRINAPVSKPPNTPDTRKRYNVIPDIYVGKNEEYDNTTKHVSCTRGVPFDMWLENKKHQKLISIQRSIEEEKIRLHEKQEKERNRKTKKMNFYEEQKKRKDRVHDDMSDKNRTSMYEEHRYLPNYQSSIIHYYMNELMLDDE